MPCDITLRANKQNLHPRMPPGKFGADELIATPDLVPIFHGDEDDVVHSVAKQGTRPQAAQESNTSKYDLSPLHPVHLALAT
jgi:hypothetical protein